MILSPFSYYIFTKKISHIYDQSHKIISILSAGIENIYTSLHTLEKNLAIKTGMS